MPGTVGLEYVADEDSVTSAGYKVIPLLVSERKDSWNELHTTNFIDDTVRLNPEEGEMMKSYPTAIALTRAINGKEQKILIVGDADCLSNAEIGMRRPNIRAANYSFIMGSFYWLSDHEVPIDTRRPTPPDNQLYVNGNDVKIAKWIFAGAFPLALLFTGLFIWIRRRSM